VRVAIIGAGAVGLGLASCLIAAGDAVEIVARDADTRDALTRRGLRRSGIFGEVQHAPESFRLLESIAALGGRASDCLLVCAKSSASREIAPAIAGVWSDLPRPPAIVLCQNGWGNAEIFATHLPRENIWNARVITGFRRSALNAVEITVHAEPVRIGCLFPDGAALHASRIDELCEHIARGGLPCEPSAEIGKDLLAKLLYNCALNPLGAILGVPYGELAARSETRALIESVVDEIFAVLDANQLATHWSTAEQYLEDFYTKLLPPTRRHESSMLQDLRAGRASEIEALTGAVVSLAEASGSSVPVNRALRDLIRAIEARATAPNAP